MHVVKDFFEDYINFFIPSITLILTIVLLWIAIKRLPGEKRKKETTLRLLKIELDILEDSYQRKTDRFKKLWNKQGEKDKNFSPVEIAESDIYIFNRLLEFTSNPTYFNKKIIEGLENILFYYRKKHIGAVEQYNPVTNTLDVIMAEVMPKESIDNILKTVRDIKPIVESLVKTKKRNKNND